MNKQQKGFTLIELVIVITIIAILAAIALPRYIAIQRDARAAKINGIVGSLRSAAALAKARCELDLAAVVAGGTCTAAGGSVNMDGTVVTMIYRYPTANAAGIVAAAGINAAADGLTISAGGAASPQAITFDVTGMAAGTCTATYNAATLVGGVQIAPVIPAPATAGC